MSGSGRGLAGDADDVAVEVVGDRGDLVGVKEDGVAATEATVPGAPVFLVAEGGDDGVAETGFVHEGGGVRREFGGGEIGDVIEGFVSGPHQAQVVIVHLAFCALEAGRLHFEGVPVVLASGVAEGEDAAVTREGEVGLGGVNGWHGEYPVRSGGRRFRR